MHAWLASIGAHPYLVLAVVFGVACAESLAVVGTFVPAGIVMFAAGALIGAGALNGWVTLAIGALGAVAGDGISYELGHRYHREVRSWWMAKGHEAVWERGERFVQRHGGKSIVLARFFAPVRAIVPLVVGASHMPRRRFYPINIASALAWSPAHIGPGIVFGAYEIRVLQHKRARTAQELFARRLIESQEQERKRVAAELHDSLGQSLQVIKGRAQLGLNRATDSPESSKQFEEISNAAGQAIQEVRAISHALRPAELDQLGLGKAIEWMVERTAATSTTKFGCEVDGLGRLPPEIEITIYRIAQEGINNVLKHANATEAILQLQQEAGTVRFSIFDNGRGLEKPLRNDGQGLMGIAERVRLLGGKFDIQSAPGKGTRLTATIPLPPDLALNRNPDPHER